MASPPGKEKSPGFGIADRLLFRQIVSIENGDDLPFAENRPEKDLFRLSPPAVLAGRRSQRPDPMRISAAAISLQNWH